MLFSLLVVFFYQLFHLGLSPLEVLLVQNYPLLLFLPDRSVSVPLLLEQSPLLVFRPQLLVLQPQRLPFTLALAPFLLPPLFFLVEESQGGGESVDFGPFLPESLLVVLLEGLGDDLFDPVENVLRTDFVVFHGQDEVILQNAGETVLHAVLHLGESPLVETVFHGYLYLYSNVPYSIT